MRLVKHEYSPGSDKWWLNDAFRSFFGGNVFRSVKWNCYDHHIAILLGIHDDVIKWKHFPRHWHFGQGIHRSPVNSPHKGQWRGTLMFSLIFAWINGWVNNREAGDLRRHRGHYDVTVMGIFVHIDALSDLWHIRFSCFPVKMTHSIISRIDAYIHRVKLTYP